MVSFFLNGNLETLYFCLLKAQSITRWNNSNGVLSLQLLTRNDSTYVPNSTYLSHGSGFD